MYFTFHCSVVHWNCGCMMEIDALLEKRQFIVENIYDISSILDHLLSASVISFDQRDEIMTKKTHSKRTNELVNVLIRCCPTAVEEFCKALTLTGYGFVADEIKTSLGDICSTKAPIPEQGMLKVLCRFLLSAIFCCSSIL